MKSIAAFEIPKYWSRIAGLLDKLLMKPGVDNSIDDIHAFLMNGQMMAWHVDWKVIIICMVSNYGASNERPTRRVFQIVYCSGEGMDEWLDDVVKELSDVAKSLGCHCLRISGREGWTKKLPSFEQVYVTLEKKL